MTTAEERPVFAPRRLWFARLLDRVLEPSTGRAARLDPRLLSPHLLRDMGLLDAADEPARPERPPAGW